MTDTSPNPSSASANGYKGRALFSIVEILKRASVPIPRIRICDIGAMSLGSGMDVWDPLFQQGLCDIVGFEPAPGECEKLNADAKSKDAKGCTIAFHPHFIGDGTEGEFRLCSAPMTSSLYEPNTELLKMFQGIEELTRVTKRDTVKTARLDDLISSVGEVDFLKMDVQGGELNVIKGGSKVLEGVCVLETEVEFVPLYSEQPLFADVDIELRCKKSFCFHRFHSLQGRCMRPLYIKQDPYRSLSQQLWGDAIYIKSLFDLSARSLEQLIKTAIILHEVYCSYDVVAYILGAYDTRCSTSSVEELSSQPQLQKKYLEALQVPKDVVNDL